MDCELDPETSERLTRLAQLVARWGARMNLSGHREAVSVLDGLIVDALALQIALMDLIEPWPSAIVDLGSGAGFPGLPLAIANRGSTIELIEARKRRHYFQRAACRELSVTNAFPRLGRIEDLEPTPSDLVVAQAVGPIQAVVSLAAPWVAVGGWLIVPSGSIPPDLDPGPGWNSHGAQPYGSSRVAHSPRSFWFAQRELTSPHRS